MARKKKDSKDNGLDLPKEKSSGESSFMEFLMTYGWAILVVLAAIGALAYFHVLDPAKFIPPQKPLNATADSEKLCSVLGMGFANVTKQMGNEYVVECFLQNDNVKVVHKFYLGSKTEPAKLEGIYVYN